MTGFVISGFRSGVNEIYDLAGFNVAKNLTRAQISKQNFFHARVHTCNSSDLEGDCATYFILCAKQRNCKQ